MTDNRIVDLAKAVRAFGGYASLARKMKVPTSTVHGWYVRSKIPPWRAVDIAQLAKRHKKDVWKEEVRPKVRGARRKASA